ncbi:hypothetical protein [Acinetobacter phage ABPH49]|nr:hypothetical protein [Acinetobacter phage ABPH49]
MTKFKGTKGPWEAFVGHGGLTLAIHTPGDRGCDNVVGWMGFDSIDETAKVKVANARLIAAAPELLEVLESIISCQENNGAISAAHLIAAKAVVRKALTQRG